MPTYLLLTKDGQQPRLVSAGGKFNLEPLSFDSPNDRSLLEYQAAAERRGWKSSPLTTENHLSTADAEKILEQARKESNVGAPPASTPPPAKKPRPRTKPAEPAPEPQETADDHEQEVDDLMG